MKNYRVIDLLRGLSAGEFRRFVLYVESPYFNQSPPLVRLIQLLQRAAPDFGEALLSKAHLHQVMFGEEEPFREQAVHDQLSRLLRLLEGFLAQQHYEADAASQDRHLLQSLDQRHLEGHFPRIYRRTEQRRTGSHLRDVQYYLDQYQLGVIGDAFFGKTQNRTFEGNMAGLVRDLDTFYLASKLRSVCEMINRRNILNKDYQPEMVQEIMDYLDRPGNPYRQIPAISIYRQIYLTLTEAEAEPHYRQLVDLLQQHTRDFSRAEAYSMYAYAQNYCIRRINQGDSAYLHELFTLYRRLLEEKLLLEEGTLAHEHYKNITTVGLRLQAYDWVRDFLDAYKEHLHPDHQENAYNYNLSVYYFEQGRYREAMLLLQQVEFTDVYYRLSAKAILLKTYYEAGDEEGLRHQARAILAFLKRNDQVSRYLAQGYANMVRFAREIARLRSRQASLKTTDFQARCESLMTRLAQQGSTSNANWLRQKLRELQSREAPVG